MLKRKSRTNRENNAKSVLNKKQQKMWAELKIRDSEVKSKNGIAYWSRL